MRPAALLTVTIALYVSGPCVWGFLPSSPKCRFSCAQSLAAAGNEDDGGNVSDDVLESLADKLARSEKEAAADEALAPPEPTRKEDNKSMAFLRKIGRVGGAANKNFVNAVGSDEGTTGRQPPAERHMASGPKKAKAAYVECTKSGTIDDMTEPFPITTSGTEWRGVSDRVVGGLSNGFIKRETDLEGKAANVLTGHVSLENGGGFIQMVTDLPLDPVETSVDASEYDGIELEVLCRHTPRSFNVHLRTPGTLKQASYRYTHNFDDDQDGWQTILIPFSSFEGYGDNLDSEKLDTSILKRIGIVATGQDMDAFLAVAGVKFYSVI